MTTTKNLLTIMAQWLFLISGLTAISAVLLYSQDLASFLGLWGALWLADRLNVSTDLNASSPFEWNILYHLGGNSPWIPKVSGIVNTTIDPPTGCRIDQVHMMSRHAERYPTVKAGIRMLELYQRVQHSGLELNGSLSFANNWNFFAPDPSTHFESLVSLGPHAGTLEAFSTGTKLRTRYKHLLDRALARNKPISFWASGSARVEETARYFGAAFFGLNHSATGTATLHIIPETPDRGADTLTPGDTCLAYADNIDAYGHDYGYRQLTAFRSTYLPAIASCLALLNPALPFTEGEIYTMQEICGFETIALGSISPWCPVFTPSEIESFEYARDLLHYYRAGPGNPYAAAMGYLYLNATASLLRAGGEAAGDLFFSFVHDGDIVPLLAALDLFPQSPHLPTTHVLGDRAWRTSDVVPMGGRIIFERLLCPAAPRCWDNGPLYPNHVYCEEARDDVFVRVNVNDGIVAIPGCDSGPGESCSLDEFLERVRKRGEEVGAFGDVCGLDVGAEREVRFLHQ